MSSSQIRKLYGTKASGWKSGRPTEGTVLHAGLRADVRAEASGSSPWKTLRPKSRSQSPSRRARIARSSSTPSTSLSSAVGYIHPHDLPRECAYGSAVGDVRMRSFRALERAGPKPVSSAPMYDPRGLSPGRSLSPTAPGLPPSPFKLSGHRGGSSSSADMPSVRTLGNSSSSVETRREQNLLRPNRSEHSPHREAWEGEPMRPPMWQDGTGRWSTCYREWLSEHAEVQVSHAEHFFSQSNMPVLSGAAIAPWFVPASGSSMSLEASPPMTRLAARDAPATPQSVRPAEEPVLPRRMESPFQSPSSSASQGIPRVKAAETAMDSSKLVVARTVRSPSPPKPTTPRGPPPETAVGSPVTFFVDGDTKQYWGRVRNIAVDGYVVDLAGGGRKTRLDAVTPCYEDDLVRSLQSRSPLRFAPSTPRGTPMYVCERRPLSTPRSQRSTSVGSPRRRPPCNAATQILSPGQPVSFFASGDRLPCFGRVRQVGAGGHYIVDLVNGACKTDVDRVTACTEQDLAREAQAHAASCTSVGSNAPVEYGTPNKGSQSRAALSVGSPVWFFEDVGRSATRLFGRIRKVKNEGHMHAYTVDLVGGGVRNNVPIVSSSTEDELAQAAVEYAARPPVRTRKDDYAEFSSLNYSSSFVERASPPRATSRGRPGSRAGTPQRAGTRSGSASAVAIAGVYHRRNSGAGGSPLAA